MYEKLKSWYDRNKDKGYAKEFIRRAVEAEKITAAQFTEITGEDIQRQQLPSAAGTWCDGKDVRILPDTIMNHSTGSPVLFCVCCLSKIESRKKKARSVSM